VGSIALVQFAANRRQETVDISYSQFTEQLDKATSTQSKSPSASR